MEEHLLRLFEAIGSQNASNIQSAEYELEKLLDADPNSTGGIALGLIRLAAAAPSAASEAARLQALLFFKNRLDGFWRHPKASAISRSNLPLKTLQKPPISENEKTEIRRILLLDFNESTSAIALQKAIVIGRMARLDFYQSWPELMPTLLQFFLPDFFALSTSLIAHYNALLTLHHVVKELASKRLGPDRRNFRELTRNCFGPIFLVFKSHFNNQGPRDERLITICLKLLRHFIAYGNSEPESQPEVLEFLRMLPCVIENFIENFAISTGWEAPAKVGMKIALELQEYHTYSFVYFMADYLALAHRIAFETVNPESIPQILQIQAMNLLKAVLLCEEYKLPNLEAFQAPEAVQNALEIKAAFFTRERLDFILQRILDVGLGLSKAELESLESDMEIFMVDAESEAWRYSFRPAAEALYASLMREFWVDLAPKLTKILETELISFNKSPIDWQNFLEIRRLDALWVAFGLSAAEIYDRLKLDELFVAMQNLFCVQIPTESQQIFVENPK